MELIILWCLFGIITAFVLNPYGKAGQGCLLGGLLGPIGLIVALVERSNLNRQAEIERENDRQAEIRSLASAAAARSTVTIRPRELPAEAREERDCPFCAEKILRKARFCKHCRRDIPEES